MEGTENRKKRRITQKSPPKASKSNKTLTETQEKLRIDGKTQCCAA